jgi:hypothetical protein
MTAVVKLDDYRTPAPPPQRSQYELYPMPFFDRDAGSTWRVTPTGDYAADVETGRRYGWAFLRSCDGTVGWAALLPAIVADMVRAGQVNGIVVGFMGVVGRMLAAVIGPKSPDPAG